MKKLPNYPTTQLPNYLPALSIVELLIGIAILAIIGVMVAGVYITHFRLFSNQTTTIDVASQNRVALDEITNQIREGSGVVATACLTTTAADKIVISLWPLSPATGEPFDPAGTNYDYAAYYVDASKNLIKKICPYTGSQRTAITKILATNLSPITDGVPANSGLFLTYYDTSNVETAPQNAAEVKIRLKISAPNFNRSQTFTSDLEAQAVLRNK